MSFRVPRKEPPNRAPAKGDAPFPEPSNYLLIFPVNGLPRFPNGPVRREAPVSRAFFYTFPSKSPVNEPHSMFPNRVTMEREASSLEQLVCSFIYICQSRIRALPLKTGKTFSHRPRSPTWTEGLHTVGCGLVPQGGSFTTLHSLPQCHAAFSTTPSTLVWIDQSPVSQRMS
jgi:hypothetical protein